MMEIRKKSRARVCHQLRRAHVKILLRNCVTEMNGYVKLVQDLFPQAKPTRRIIA